MTAHGLSHRAGRAVTSLSRHGVRGTAERARHWLIEPVARKLFLHERHVWIDIKLDVDPDPLPDGYLVRRGGPDDLAALAAIGGIAPQTARRYLDEGAELYVAMHGDDLAFSVWLHRGSVPLLAAPGGRLALPDGVLSFEDSIAAPEHRRSGISSTAVEHIKALQHRRGVTAIITRMAEDNVAARRWTRKLGSTEVAMMSLRRIGPWRRVTIEPLPGGERVAALLATQVGRR
jgi:GNAT superfamily N-acetyltransferase